MQWQSVGKTGKSQNHWVLKWPDLPINCYSHQKEIKTTDSLSLFRSLSNSCTGRHFIIAFMHCHKTSHFTVPPNISGPWKSFWNLSRPYEKRRSKRVKNTDLAVFLKQVSVFWSNRRVGLKVRWIQQAFLEYPCFPLYSHSDRLIRFFTFAFFLFHIFLTSIIAIDSQLM